MQTNYCTIVRYLCIIKISILPKGLKFRYINLVDDCKGFADQNLPFADKS